MTGLFVASNATALSAQFQLTRNIGALGETLTRLSTGLRINSGKDDPAGLIASELLRAQITGTTQAITNTQRANGLIATADSSLGQVGNLLNDIKGLVVEAAQTGTMTAAQLEANQLQIDAALNSIDRIARTTNYGGKKLLDGSLDFSTAGRSAGISNLQINSANFGTASAIGVNVNVTQAADFARLISHGTGVGVDTTFDVIGNRGSATINVGASTSNADIAAAINRSTDSTGVLAYVEGLAARGSVTLSSAGANNDIVITALREGFDAGNYSFRITRGTENDARVVQEAGPNQMGIIEIALVEAYEQRYNNFAGLFNITIDTTNRVDAAGVNIADTAETSVTMTRGDANRVEYSNVDRAASTNVISGRSITAEATAGTPTSALNGWTVVVDDSIASGAADWRVDLNSKLVFVNSASANTDVQDALADAMARTNASANPAVTATFNFDATTNPLQNGDRFTFAGGISAGEVKITYREGATANEILAMLNSAPNVSASLAHGVNGNALIPMLPNGRTEMRTDHAGAGTTNSVSRFSSGATAQDVIDLVNSRLGDKFIASALVGGASGGRVSFMDAAVDYGDVNLGNALRFTGMDNGPIIRMTTTGVNGMPIANQQLGINIILPSQADIEAGIHTPILEIRLATDQQGNSITSARQLVDFFNTLTPEQTMGVSVAQLFPPGVDPNGRIFGTGECGRSFIMDGDCPTKPDGIVQPTGVPGLCGMQQGDLLLLGTNQRVVADNALARIAGNRPMAGAAATSATSTATGHTGTTVLNFGNTSAVNGMSFGFTRDETREGFDANTGTLLIFMGPQFTATPDAAQAAALTTAVNDAVASNWEAIRAFTGATGDAVRLATDMATGDVTTAIADAIMSDDPAALPFAGTTTIVGTFTEGTGVGGHGTADPAMVITAKQEGTQMAGINIHFINDTESGLAQWNDAYSAGYVAGADLPELDVKFVTNQDGSRALVVTGNLGPTAASELNAGLLARALNANSTFNRYFTADATQIAAGAAAGGGEANSVLFTTDVTKPSTRTVGGYRIESDGTGATTSSGIGMTGQSDANERLVIESEELGSNAHVSINVIRGFLNTVGMDGRAIGYASGSDMMATVNGLRAVTQGNNVSINTADLALSMNVANGVGNHGFTITGGGALFQLGPDVVSQQQMRIGIGSMLTTNLGGADGQLFMLRRGEVASVETGGDQGRMLADRIVNQAIQSVATTRGQLGAIQRGALEPNILALQDSLTALTEANAMITNADFAVESSNLTRLQLLIQAGAQTLGIANQLPQYAAMLVR